MYSLAHVNPSPATASCVNKILGGDATHHHISLESNYKSPGVNAVHTSELEHSTNCSQVSQRTRVIKQAPVTIAIGFIYIYV